MCWLFPVETPLSWTVGTIHSDKSQFMDYMCHVRLLFLPIYMCKDHIPYTHDHLGTGLLMSMPVSWPETFAANYADSFIFYDKAWIILCFPENYVSN